MKRVRRYSTYYCLIRIIVAQIRELYDHCVARPPNRNVATETRSFVTIDVTLGPHSSHADSWILEMYEGGGCDVRSMQRGCNGQEQSNFHGLLNGAQSPVNLADIQTVSGNYLVVFSLPRFEGIRINFAVSNPFQSWKRFEHPCEARSR